MNFRIDDKIFIKNIGKIYIHMVLEYRIKFLSRISGNMFVSKDIKWITRWILEYMTQFLLRISGNTLVSNDIKWITTWICYIMCIIIRNVKMFTSINFTFNRKHFNLTIMSYDKQHRSIGRRTDFLAFKIDANIKRSLRLRSRLYA